MNYQKKLKNFETHKCVFLFSKNIKDGIGGTWTSTNQSKVYGMEYSHRTRMQLFA